MKLWTHHSSTFRIDDPHLTIDASLGQYCQDEERDFKYREVLPQLWEFVGTDQFLWCCTVRDQIVRMTESIDLVEWEPEVPMSQIVAFYRVQVWDDIIRNRADNWDDLIISVEIDNDIAKPEIGALVRVPLLLDDVKRLGPLERRYGS